jgi:hypothetical protein
MSDSELHDKIVATNILIETELHKWEDIGATPQNVQVDMFILDAYINALADFLVEKGIIEDEEFTFHFKKRLLSNLVLFRENVVEPGMAEARRQQIVNGLPAQDIPKKRRMH